MEGFLAGLAIGFLIGVAGFLILLILGTVILDKESKLLTMAWSLRVLLWAVSIAGVTILCLALKLDKAEVVLLLLMLVVAVARLEGFERGLVASGLCAVMLAAYLPPAQTLRIDAREDKALLALFIGGAVFCSLVGEKNRKRKGEM